MIRLALRLERASGIGFGATVVLLGVAQAAAFVQLAGASTAEREAFGAQMALLGRQLSYLLPLPERIDTLGGYLQWRFVGALPLLLGPWAVLSATGAARGDEERGLAEAWLAAGVSRGRLLAARAGGFLLALALVLATMFGAVLASRNGEPLEPADAAGAAVALLALLAVVYAISLVASQLALTRRGAAGLSFTIVVALFFANGFSRGTAGPLTLGRYVSPFALLDRSDPLVPGGAFDAAATAALALVALALGLAAAALAARRDLGAALLARREPARPAVRTPARSALLGTIAGAELRGERGALVAWGGALALLALFMGALARAAVDAILAVPGFGGYVAALGGGDPYQAFFGFMLSGIVALAVAGYAIARVGAWGADDADGRLAAVLAAGISRSGVVLQRAAALVIAVAFLGAVTALASAAGALVAGLDLDGLRLALAGAFLVPLAGAFGGIGALLLARAPRAATGALGALAVWSYCSTQLGPLFHVPDWVLRSSLFDLYGVPLAGDVRWAGEGALLGSGLLGFGLAAVLMRDRDIGG